MLNGVHDQHAKHFHTNMTSHLQQTCIVNLYVHTFNCY